MSGPKPDDRKQVAKGDAEGGDEGGGPSRGALIAIVAIVLMVAGGVWLSQHIRASNRLQDCVMAGRTNCAPVQ